MSHPAHYKFIAFAVISSIVSSVCNLYKSQGLKYIEPFSAATIGILFAGFISLLILLILRRLPSINSIRLVLPSLLVVIVVRSFVANLLFTWGLSKTTAIEAIFLTKMEPYIVIFWAWLLDKERPSGKHLALLIIHIAGAILLSVGDFSSTNSMSLTGDLLIMIAVVIAAFSYRFIPRVSKTLTPIQSAAISETCGGILSLPFFLYFYNFNLSPEQWQEQLVGWSYIAIHAVMFYSIAIPLLYASLSGIPAWISSALRATGPLVATPIAFIFFDESLNSIQLFGAGMVLLTSALISKRNKKV